MGQPYNSSDCFIGREAELNRIIGIVNSLAVRQTKSFERVLHLNGQANIGKSHLLMKCSKKLMDDKKNIPIQINLEEFHTSRADDFGMGLLRYVATKINIAALEEDISLHEISTTLQNQIKEQRDKIFVLLIDECDHPTRDCIEVLEDHLLAWLVNEPNIVFILTSRVKVTSWKDFSLRPVEGNVLELGTFSKEETAKHLQCYYDNEQVSDDLVKKVFSLSNGSPGNNEIILKFAVEEPPKIRDELAAIQACNQELTISIQAASTLEFTNDDLRYALDGLCILQDFERDEEAPIFLREHPHFRRWTHRQITQLLQALQLIDVGPGHLIMWNKTGALSIEKQTKESLENELKLRDKKLWKKLHNAAIKMYQLWAEEYNDLHLFISKVQYHQEQLQRFGGTNNL